MEFVKLTFHVCLRALFTIYNHRQCATLNSVFNVVFQFYSCAAYFGTSTIVMVFKINLCKSILLCNELKSMKNILEISFNTETSFTVLISTP